MVTVIIKAVTVSRSRKKHPVVKQKNDKWFKGYSNRKIRHSSIQSGGMFRKVLDTWCICDWRYYPTDKEDIERSFRK